MIKNIIFDNNGVLTSRDKDGVYQNVAEFIGVSMKELKPIWDEGAKPLDDGRMTNREFLENLLQKLGRQADIDKLMEIYLGSYQPNREMQMFVQTLKGKYRLMLLTNFGEAFHQCRVRWGIDRIFDPDKVFLSSDLKMRKPHKDIYEYVVKEMGIHPEETVFVDDREANIQTANELHMRGILFENLEKFKKDLDNVIEEKAYAR